MVFVFILYKEFGDEASVSDLRDLRDLRDLSDLSDLSDLLCLNSLFEENERDPFVSFSFCSGTMLSASMVQLPSTKRVLGAGIVPVLLCTASLAYAQEQAFSDVPPDHFAFQAVEFLKANGILSGYPDGTFKPDKLVNRAEGVKIVVAPLLKSDVQLAGITSVYDDIPTGAWYLPFVDIARRELGIIDGPPKSLAFHGERPVNKAEFFKILLLAHKADPTGAYAEIRLPLAADVTNPDEWYYPYVRFAIAASMTSITPEGMLQPGKALTRGEVAVLLHRYLMYTDGRRAQALLSETDTELLNTLHMIEVGEYLVAQYASARALVAARGALASKPDEPIVKGAVKTAEAFRALVSAFEAERNDDLVEAIRLAKETWHLAEQAREFSPSLTSVSEQLQQIASSIADNARDRMGEE